MPLQFPNIYRLDISNGEPIIKQLPRIGQNDMYANRIGVELYNGSTPVTPGGNCIGEAVLYNGVTVPMANGVVSGNLAYVDLLPACYAVPGPIRITVKWTDGTTETTIFQGFGNVSLTETGTVIDPGTIIPSVSALIADIAEASASIPADYTALLAAIAPNYSTSATYTAGQYVWHSGTLYKANQDIPVSESWTAAHWDPSVVADELAGLSDRINETQALVAVKSSNLYNPAHDLTGAKINPDGSITTDANYNVTEAFTVPPGKQIAISAEVASAGARAFVKACRCSCVYPTNGGTPVRDNDTGTASKYTNSGTDPVQVRFQLYGTGASETTTNIYITIADASATISKDTYEPYGLSLKSNILTSDPMTLTSAQKTQARQNIGAVAASDAVTPDALNDFAAIQRGASPQLINILDLSRNQVKTNTSITNRGVESSGTTNTVFVVPIPKIGVPYVMYGLNSGGTQYINVLSRWTMHDANGAFLRCILDNAQGTATPDDARCAYCKVQIANSSYTNDYPPFILQRDSTSAIPLTGYVRPNMVMYAQTAEEAAHATTASSATTAASADTAALATTASTALNAKSAINNAEILTANSVPFINSSSYNTADYFSLSGDVYCFDDNDESPVGVAVAIRCYLGKRTDVENQKICIRYTASHKAVLAINASKTTNWGSGSKYRELSDLAAGTDEYLETTITTTILNKTNQGGAFADTDSVWMYLLIKGNTAAAYANACHVKVKYYITRAQLLSGFPMPGEETHEQWFSKVWTAYGDSITAISNGNGLDKGWAKYVNQLHQFSGFYGRGIGSQSFEWKSHGGAACFINADGTYNSRNNSYNKDNYTGEIPTGTTLTRGAFCSWDRITHMYPASIKDSIDMIFVMGATNDIMDDTALSFVSGDATDPEWAASDYYATYGGDYNIATLRGGIASTIMKMQAWMPNAILVLATPCNGQTNSSDFDGEGKRRPNYIPDEFEKSQIVREIASVFGIPCVDVFSSCGINVLNSPDYITDGTHPYSVPGYKMLARAVAGGLRGIYPNL